MHKLTAIAAAILLCGCNSPEPGGQQAEVRQKDARSTTVSPATATSSPEPTKAHSVKSPIPEELSTRSAPLEVDAVATPVISMTPQPTAATEPSPSPRVQITPVSDSEGAKNLAQMGATPGTSAAPQIVRVDPKEVDRSSEDPLHIYGFNLNGARVTAAPQAGGNPVSLNADQTSQEQLTIQVTELQKLEPGSYNLSVQGESGLANYQLQVQ